MTVTSTDLATSYLQRPYGRLVVPERDGTFRGEILEFPGCIATADTASEAITILEEVAKEWLEAAIDNGQNIPEPVECNEFSGRLALRLPKSLHKKAAMIAEREGVSLNQFIMVALAEHIGERTKSFGSISITSVLPANAINIIPVVNLLRPNSIEGSSLMHASNIGSEAQNPRWVKGLEHARG